MNPSEILRNRCRAVGVNMTDDEARGVVQSLCAQGFKLVARDCGESYEVVMDFGPLKPDGSRDAKLATDDPRKIWSQIWDQMGAD